LPNNKCTDKVVSDCPFFWAIKPASITASATFGYSASPDNVTMALQ
jgi:hypothetical protein